MTGRGPGVRPVLASLALHLAILVPIVAFTRAPRSVEFDTIRIVLVSAPAPVEATRPAPQEPEPQPEPVEEPTPEPVVEQPRPEPEVEQPRPEPPPQRPAERPRTERPTPPAPTPPPRTPPAAEPTAPTEGINLETEGIDFPFPDYLNNVVAQLYRYLRWTEPGNPRATIYFEIMDDGSVRNIRMLRPSGNIRFDYAVQGAVETAGNRGAFGPLPDAYVGASLPVQLVVEPAR
jgi:periplasmic protein TonB